MPLLVRNLKLRLGEPEDSLPALVARRLKVPISAIDRYAPVRRSLDARDHDDIFYSYNVQVSLGSAEAEQRVLRYVRRGDVEPLRESEPPRRPVGSEPLRERPVIVGFGPAGMFAGLLLAEYGYRPIILERGRDVRRRHADILERFYREGHFDPESNLLFGEGGAGAYSDGKIYTRVHDARVDEVLRVLYRFGAAPHILTDGRPHIGSDKLPGICRRIRLHIESLGGEVRFEQRVTGLEVREGRIAGVFVGAERIAAEVVLLGTGHSARDTYRLLAASGVRLVAKPYQLGLRIEHPQGLVDRWQYGAACESHRLPPSDYHIVARGAGGEAGDVFSFCMCPGGEILLTNEAEGLIATNGASRSSRGGAYANSGLVVSFRPGEGAEPLGELAFQESWERKAFEIAGRQYRVPAQRAVDFLAGRMSDGELETSCPVGATWADVRAVVPAVVAEAVARALPMFERRMPGFAGMDGVLTGPESRVSAPVRVLRDEATRESVSVAGLYPVGEGAGYAGGIVSSAVDAMKSAEVVMAKRGPAR